MPNYPQAISETAPKTGSAQYQTRRISGLLFKVPTLSPVASDIPVGRMVTIQEDSLGNQYAVLGFKAYEQDEYETYTVIGYGVIEEALQSGITGNAAPTPNVYNDGDRVTVITGAGLICALEHEADHAPAVGIAVTNNTVDDYGRLTDRTAGANYKQLTGAVSYGVPSTQMANQLKPDHAFYQFVSPLAP